MTIIMSSFNMLIIVIGMIFLFAWAIEENDEERTTKINENSQKIHSIPIFTPEKCSKKVKVGNEVTIHFTLRLENENGKIIASSHSTKELFTFQVGGKEVIIGKEKIRLKKGSDKIIHSGFYFTISKKPEKIILSDPVFSTKLQPINYPVQLIEHPTLRIPDILFVYF